VSLGEVLNQMSLLHIPSESQGTLLRLLHDIGLLLHFPDPKLKHMVILDPEYLIGVLVCYYY
jgi:hypothetical protein